MRSTLVHPRHLTPIVPVGWRKDGRPIYPILGGSGDGDDQGGNGGDNGGGGNAGGGTGGQDSGDSGDSGDKPPSDPNDPDYFPPNTPVAEMTAVQQAAYWRNQAKVQQRRVPKNLDELLDKASKWEQVERERMTPSEKALAEAREAGKAEGLRAAGQQAAEAILRASLSLRGKNTEQIDAVMRGVNAAGFLGQNNDVDTGAIATFVDSIAGPAQGGGGQQQRGDTGQGRRENQAGSGVAAGRDAYRQQREARRSRAGAGA